MCVDDVFRTCSGRVKDETSVLMTCWERKECVEDGESVLEILVQGEVVWLRLSDAEEGDCSPRPRRVVESACVLFLTSEVTLNCRLVCTWKSGRDRRAEDGTSVLMTWWAHHRVC